MDREPGTSSRAAVLVSAAGTTTWRADVERQQTHAAAQGGLPREDGDVEMAGRAPHVTVCVETSEDVGGSP